MCFRSEVRGSSELGGLFVFLANLRRDRTSIYLRSELRGCDRTANKILFLGIGLFVVLALMAVFVDKEEPIPEWVDLLMLLGVVTVQLLGLSSILVRLGGAISMGVRRKKVALTSFILEVESDEQHVSCLIFYSDALLEKARRYLELKIKRTERRVGSILGEKTAVISLFALSISLLDGLGGVSAVFGFFSSVPDFFSLKMLLMSGFAFLLGISIGAVLLNSSIEGIRYQLELIELAQAEKHRQRSSMTSGDTDELRADEPNAP